MVIVLSKIGPIHADCYCNFGGSFAIYVAGDFFAASGTCSDIAAATSSTTASTDSYPPSTCSSYCTGDYAADCVACCRCCCGNEYANGVYAGDGRCPRTGDCK